LLAVLNSPVLWWHNFRQLPHMKDEALAPVAYMVEVLPIAQPTAEIRHVIENCVRRLIAIDTEQRTGRGSILDWLHAEHAIEKPSQKLQNPAALDADGLISEVKKARGKANPLTVAGVKALKDEHVRTVAPLQTLAAETRQLERQVSDLVNAAYGLTPDEIALMWQTAPPRMPLDPPPARRENP